MRASTKVLAAAACVGGTLVVAPAPASAGAFAQPVDIRVELDLPVCCGVGPLVLEVLDVTPGPGPELTDDDVVDNPNEYNGALQVDIDPDAQTITISFDDLPDGDTTRDYETALVRITTDEIGSASLVSDTLWEEPANMSITGPTVASGALSVSWDDIDDSAVDISMTGSAVISYGASSSSASLSPERVDQGSPVTVTGTGCPNSPVEIAVTPQGGTEPVIEDEVLGDADGSWTYEIDTSDLDVGPYDVATRCVLADLQGFDYPALVFSVSFAGAEPQPEPAVPAPAAPRFTG